MNLKDYKIVYCKCEKNIFIIPDSDSKDIKKITWGDYINFLKLKKKKQKLEKILSKKEK